MNIISALYLFKTYQLTNMLTKLDIYPSIAKTQIL